MPAEVLSVGTNTTPSADFTLTEATLVFIKTSTGGPIPLKAQILVQAKGSGNNYHNLSVLTTDMSSGVLPAGVYRALRPMANGPSIGLERS